MLYLFGRKQEQADTTLLSSIHTNIMSLVSTTTTTTTTISTTPSENIPTTTTPIIVKTSKEWILPPRPKPGRKPVGQPNNNNNNQQQTPQLQQQTQQPIKPRKKYQRKTTAKSSIPTSLTQLSDLCEDINDLTSVVKNIKIIESENLSLKSTLLSLIHDYSHLKNLVLNPKISLPLDSNVHKRSYNEVQTFDETSSNISSTNEFEKFINMDIDEDEDIIKKTKFNKYSIDSDLDEDDIMMDEDLRSPLLSATSSAELSRTTSPYSDDCFSESNSLMSTLTRSTTVESASAHTIFEKPMFSFKKVNNFFDLPRYEEQEGGDDYNFKFDELMNVKKSRNDQYNMITDFLEEKLLNNDIRYYIDNNNEPTTTNGSNNTGINGDEELVW